MTRNTVTTEDGARLYYRDQGAGRPVVFSHDWPLSSDFWDLQLNFLASRGYRAVAHDRRGHGRSDRPSGGNDMDTYAADLAALINGLDLKSAVVVGHGVGSGEVARYLGRYSTARVAKVVLVGAVTPLMLKTVANPNGTPVAVFNEMRARVAADRAQFFDDFAAAYYGANRPGANVSRGVRETFRAQALAGGLENQLECIGSFSETDFTEDLKRIDVLTLVVHGDDDQTVPIVPSALRTARLIRGAILKVYEGAPHGLPVTHADRFNADLLAFLAG